MDGCVKYGSGDIFQAALREDRGKKQGEDVKPPPNQASKFVFRDMQFEGKKMKQGEKNKIKKMRGVVEYFLGEYPIQDIITGRGTSTGEWGNGRKPRVG